MSFVDKLESKYGKFAIPNLNFYLTVVFTLGLVIQLFNASFYVDFLALDINKLLHGQIWRIFTFLFYPPGGGALIFALLSLYVYYSLTKMLIISTSDFKFNYFVLQGILFQLLSGIMYKIITGTNIVISPSYFIFSIMLTFCFTFSDATMLFYFIIPIKAKWIAYIELFFFLNYFITGGLADKIIIIFTLINVFTYLKLLKIKP